MTTRQVLKSAGKNATCANRWRTRAYKVTSGVTIALIGKKKKHVQRIFLYTSIRVEPRYPEHLWVKRKTV